MTLVHTDHYSEQITAPGVATKTPIRVMDRYVVNKARDFVYDPVTPEEIIERFWEKVYYMIDVDDIVYDLISDYDGVIEEQNIPGWYMEEDTDEKDSLRDEVLTKMGYPFH